MERQILHAVHTGLGGFKGKVLYSQGDRAWSLVRLKKDILDKFPQLREKRIKFSYEMVIHKTYNDLEKAIKDLKKNEEAIPILLFLYKEKQDFPN